MEAVRQGEDYISIKNPVDPTGKNIRLKGGHDKSSGVIGKYIKEAEQENNRNRTATVEPDKPSIKQTREKLSQLAASRAEFNQKKYVASESYGEKGRYSNGSYSNNRGMSFNDSHKSMVELAKSRDSKTAGRASWTSQQKTTIQNQTLVINIEGLQAKQVGNQIIITRR